MTTNLQNVFDAIVGYEGSAAVDDWREMSRDTLIQTADGMANNFYDPISQSEAERVADAVIKYRESNNSNDGYYARKALED